MKQAWTSLVGNRIERPSLSPYCLLLFLAIASAVQADDFKVAGDCLVYDYDTNYPATAPKHTSYQWSGACDADGFATGYGIFRAYWDNELDEESLGTLVKGRLEGFVITNSGHGHFEGNYNHGERSGSGVVTWVGKSGQILHYEGGFTRGQADGYGTETHADGWHYEGSFVRGSRTGHGIESGTTLSGLHYRHEGNFIAGVWTGQDRTDGPASADNPGRVNPAEPVDHIIRTLAGANYH